MGKAISSFAKRFYRLTEIFFPSYSPDAHIAFVFVVTNLISHFFLSSSSSYRILKATTIKRAAQHENVGNGFSFTPPRLQVYCDEEDEER